ncbi:uncharacterized protein LOC120626540 [Pararge aegeria]|nr:uncharacterized protein LOC120626540 [Pararge aegeria]
MAQVLLLLFGIIVFQGCSEAAPNEKSHPADGAGEDVTLDHEPHSHNHQTRDNDASQNQRQKRFYDYVGFDYPPYDFPNYPYPSQPHYSKRDDTRNTAVYGTEDALSLIFRRLREILRDVRYQNVPRPVQTPVPAYIPFVYIPQFDCGCTSNNQGPAPPVNYPNPQPTNSYTPSTETTTTSNTVYPLGNRFGLDDNKRNWGLMTNKPDLNNIGTEGDGSRPINFNPVLSEEPLEVPVPPVDHGTVQAGAESEQNSNPIVPSPQLQNTPAPSFQPSRPIASGNQQSTPSTSFKKNIPSLCDGAIIRCCNQIQITDKCFELQGCEDPSIYGNPCDAEVQLKVINKFQAFHKTRRG